MSRIGKKPIPVPAGVELKVEGNTALVSGPKGKLSQEIPAGIEVVLEDGAIVVKRPNDEKKFRALHGLTRSLLANMVEGVSTGYSKTLEVNGVGYRAAKQGNKLVLTVGYSHPVEIEPFPESNSKYPRLTRSSLRVSTNKKSDRWLLRSEVYGNLNLIRARVFAMKTNMSGKKPVRQVKPVNSICLTGL